MAKVHPLASVASTGASGELWEEDTVMGCVAGASQQLRGH